MNDVDSQRVAAKAFIVHEGKVLIIKEANTEDATQIGLYQLPGGRVKVGEPFFEGLRREIKEETSLVVTPKDPLFVGEWSPVIKDKKVQIIAIFYICEANSSEVVLSEEHDGFEWINPAKYNNFELAEPEPEVFQRYLSNFE